MFSRDAIDAARRVVYAAMPPTPQQRWPQLDRNFGAQLWVKHENHTPTGAFKVRGGLTYFEGLRRREPKCTAVISATRGNHGQSVGFAALRHDMAATIVAPLGNSVEKNAAMRALGVDVIEHGQDFQESREHAVWLAGQRGLHMVPSFHEDLVRGVATYWVEFFEVIQPDVVFVPIGLGSGICACAAARAHVGAKSRIVGVVSAHATTYRQSFEAGRVIEAPVTTVLADGLACRIAEPQALEIMRREVDDVIAVSDTEVGAAMRTLFSCTHNVAEGAGAAALAGAWQQRERWRGRCVGVTITGGNVDSALFAQTLIGA
ncbi:MAG: threonine dehydratase [Burkholderiales bacterium]|jgi:threonine dehydratase|nr:threonine dehydratase [Burkholderiales bacterium]